MRPDAVMKSLQRRNDRPIWLIARFDVGAAGGLGARKLRCRGLLHGGGFLPDWIDQSMHAEAGTSDAVKDMLQRRFQDTAYAPAGDMFELGAKVQVMKTGCSFPARANKLYGLYLRHNSIDEIDEKTRDQIEKQYLGAPSMRFGKKQRRTIAKQAAKASRKLNAPRSKKWLSSFDGTSFTPVDLLWPAPRPRNWTIKYIADLHSAHSIDG